MTEYSLSFSEKLIDAASFVAKEDLDQIEAKRTVLYLSLLSCEISIKALLEKSGMPVGKIKALSHNHIKLLSALSNCEIEKEYGDNRARRWFPATEIRSLTIDNKYSNATLGHLLSGEDSSASVYPNQIRYGSSLTHYPPEIMVEVAKIAFSWANKYSEKIRLLQKISI